MIANSTAEYIRETVLHFINEHGSFTIPAIAEETGLSSTTIAKHVTEMLETRLIEEIGAEEAWRKGRRAIVYGIKPDSHYFIGVDVRNACLGIGLVDFKGNLLKSVWNSGYAYENSHSNFEELCSIVSDFIEKLEPADRDRISAVGFNLGGRVNAAKGTSASVFTFEETQDTPLAQILQEKFNVPAFIENDTKAMAYADYIAAGRAWPNVLYVNFSWGLGLGIIIDGELYYGSNGFSGEMGHIHAYENNIMCHCGKKGCIETEVSGRAMNRKLVERVRDGEASVLSPKIRRGEDISEHDLQVAIEREDPLCIEILTETARELGRQMAGMINLFNPDCIIIGGDVVKMSKDYFQGQVELAVKQYSLRLMSRNVQTMTSPLGQKAGMLGAALCARKRLFNY